MSEGINKMADDSTETVVLRHGMESRDNPFQPDGDLCKEAEEMLRRSTISRTQVVIDDPEKENADETDNFINAVNTSDNHASPKKGKIDANQNSSGVMLHDIKVDNCVSASVTHPVEGEVSVVKVKDADNSMQVEHVKLKEKKKCACCVVM